MATNAVNIRVSATDKVSGELDKIQAKFQRLGPTGFAKDILSGVAMGGGIAAFGLLSTAVGTAVGSLGDMVEAARQDEASVKQLQTAVEAAGLSWNQYEGAIDDTIRKGQDLAFADDETRESLKNLVAVTKDANEAIKLNGIAMDLARLKGMDMKTSSELIGKVWAGNLGTLSRYGIVLEKGATKTEALAKIQQMAAGQAEGYARTSAGAMDKLQIAMDEAGEAIGRLVTGPLTALAGVLTTVANVIGAVADGLGKINLATAPEHSANIERYAAAIGLIDDEATTLQQVLGPVATGMMATGEEAVKSAQSIEGLGSDVDVLIQQLGLVDPAVQGLVESMPAVVETFDGAMGQLKSQVGSLPSSFGGSMAAAAEEAKAKAQEIPAAISEGLIAGIEDLNSGLTEMRTRMDNSMTDIVRIHKLKGILSGEELAAGLSSTDSLVREAAQKVKASIERELALLEKSAASYGHNTVEAYGDGMIGAMGSLRAKAAKVAGAVRGQFVAYSPLGPESPLHEIDKWGYRTGEAWATGLEQGLLMADTGVVSAINTIAANLKSAGMTIPQVEAANVQAMLEAAKQPGAPTDVGLLQSLPQGYNIADLPQLSANYYNRMAGENAGTSMGMYYQQLAQQASVKPEPVSVSVTVQTAVPDPQAMQEAADALMPYIVRAVERTGVSLA